MRNYIISIYGSTGLYQMNTSKVYSYLVNNGFTVGNYVATGSMTYNGVVSRIMGIIFFVMLVIHLEDMLSLLSDIHQLA